MALTTVQMVDECATVLGTGARTGDPLRVPILRWINMACRTIAYSYDWDGMRAEQILVTAQPYSTGTATFTEGSTTVTGTGTTWATTVAGAKIALSVGAPIYRIATRDSATQVTLADAYREDTATDSTYTIFQDEYNLAATTHAIEDIEVIKDRVLGKLTGVSQRDLDAADYVGSSTGRPLVFSVCTSTTVNTPRIRVLPIPDDVYRLRVLYTKTWTAIAEGGDSYAVQGLPEDVEELIIDRALRWAPRIEGSRRVMTDREWREELRRVYYAHRKRRYAAGVRRGFSTPSAPSILVDMSGLTA
jgi:hypothetical protein